MRFAVLDGVGERLLHDAVHARLQLGLEPLRHPAVLERQVDRGVDVQAGLTDAVDEREQRRLQAELVQSGRAQLGDEAAQVGDV